MTTLLEQDAEIKRIIDAEAGRQKRKIVLIASENYASRAVLEAQGSILTNKYAEGYPGRRYYGGCEYVDQAESLAIDRAKELFGAEHVNVQPHAGAQANMGVYFSLLEPGDTVMGLRLDQGGHLTHGSPVNFSGRYYNFVSYGVDPDTELIDYDEVDRLARGAQAQDNRRRRNRLPADHRLRPFPSGHRRGGGAAYGGHGPHSRAGGSRGPPLLRPPRPGCHHHHPQDPAGTPGRDDHVQPGPGKLHRQGAFSPACRADPSCTPSPPRPWHSARRCDPSSSSTSRTWSTTPESWPTSSRSSDSE